MPTTLIRKGQLKPLDIVDIDIASNAAIATSKLADGANFLKKDGSVTMTGPLQMGNNLITGLATPTNATDAATKGYVDSIALGLDVKASVKVASTANISATYNSIGGVLGVGRFTGAPNTIDGVTLVVNDRILIKDQTNKDENGIYVVSILGTGSNGTWDRASDFNSSSNVTPGAFTFVEQGNTNSDSGWVLTTNGTITVGTASGSNIAFAQFSGAGSIDAGDGLSKTGNTLSVNVASGRLVIVSDTVDLAQVTQTTPNAGVTGTNFVQSVTVDSYGRVTGVQNATHSSASISAAGIVQLNDTVTSTSTSQAATANAVKQANDNANSRLSASTSSTQSGYFGDIFLYDDSTPSHYLGITNSANLTAARTLSINVNDNDRTISLSGNLTVSGTATITGTNTGDQTITLTGDVTGSGTGSFATTINNSAVTTVKIADANVTTAKIANNAVDNTKFRQSAARSVVGNATGATANVADIEAALDHQVLRRSGSGIGFGAINLASGNAVTGVLPIANGGTGSSTAGGVITALGWVFKAIPTVITAGTVYELGFQVSSGTDHVYLNGVLMNEGVSDDYQLSVVSNKTRITFNYSIDTNDVIQVTYLKDLGGGI